DGPILPTTQPAVMSWVTSLAGQVQPKTIKAYLSAVCSLHVDTDLPFSICESPVVQHLIRSIKHFQGERDCKPVQPITRPILLTILAQLQPGNCTHISLTLPSSKMDPFHKGITITIATAPSQPLCPIGAIKHLYTFTPRADNMLLFEGLNGKPLHYRAFIAGIRSSLTAAGINPSSFAGHSLCCGTATEAAAAGFNDHKIQLLGRWRSNAYILYIENPISRILHLSYQLHLAHPHSAPFEPPALQGYAPVA
ncbi:hypothetical protein K438DRAFT_1589766, partial [Mycena galopus ATCC 62051]